MRAERRPRKSRALFAFVGLVSGVALTLAFGTYQHYGSPSWFDVGFFLIIVGAINLHGRMVVPMGGLALVREEEGPRGLQLAPGFIILVTAAFATKPSTAITVAALSELPELLKRDRRNPLKFIFNVAQQATYVGAASIVFATIRGLDGPPAAFAGAAAGAVVAQSLNTLLVAGVVSLSDRVDWKDALRQMTWIIPHSFGFGFVALMVATLYGSSGPLGAIFLIMPLFATRIVRQAKLGLDKQREDTLTEFVRAVEAKDPYTFRHSERVASITIELHKELGTPSAQLEKRWYAALLHDLGKVRVPEGILEKTSSLSPFEYALIKEHPGVGADVVSEIDLLKDLASEIRAHHERVDGRGYPDGLSGDEIPFAARVLAVADAFEALTSDRPYRLALSAESALDELERHAGVQHDPEAVDALRKVLGRGVSFVRPASGSLSSRVGRLSAAAQ
jgi:putative nucleotidyltransferase with HDIG domain